MEKLTALAPRWVVGPIRLRGWDLSPSAPLVAGAFLCGPEGDVIGGCALWCLEDPAEPKLVQEFQVPQMVWTRGVAFQGEEHLVVTGQDTRRVRLDGTGAERLDDSDYNGLGQAGPGVVGAVALGVRLFTADGQRRGVTVSSSARLQRFIGSRDGRWAATTGDRYLRLLDLDKSKQVKRLRGWGPSFSPDGKLLAHADRDEGAGWSTSLLVRKVGGKWPVLVRRPLDGAQDTAFSPDGQTLAVSVRPRHGEGRLLLLDVEGLDERGQWSARRFKPRHVRFGEGFILCSSWSDDERLQLFRP